MFKPQSAEQSDHEDHCVSSQSPGHGIKHLCVDSGSGPTRWSLQSPEIYRLIWDYKSAGYI